LRNVAAKLLPSQIIDRPKQGFPIPIERWLQKEAKPLMLDLLSSDSLRKRGLFNVPFVETLIKQHVSGFADNSIGLWGLMSLEMWLRRFIDVKHQVTQQPHREVKKVTS
jgi:asparagine synthase (glutamine-hydrolysing)